MTAKNKSELVAWEPEFSPDALAHMDKLRRELVPQLELMREFRKTLKLTQKQVAEALGVTQSNVSKIESGGDPSLSVLARMASAKGRKLQLRLERADGSEEASFDLSRLFERVA